MAELINENRSNPHEEGFVAWTTGSATTQEANQSLTTEVVLKHLKLLYLLSEKIIASATYFIESRITQQVTDALKLFFEEGDIVYFVNVTSDSPIEHAMRKIERNPKESPVYQNKDLVLASAKKLDIFRKNILRRSSDSISDKMADLWIHEVLSTRSGSIGARIAKEVESENGQNTIKHKLIDFANNRGNKDFVWKYLEPILESLRLNNPNFRDTIHFRDTIRRRLSRIHALAVARALGIASDENLNNDLINESSAYDTSLFAACLEQLELLEPILQLNNYELMRLKSTLEFTAFRVFYFDMITDCKYQRNSIKGAISTFSKIENHITREDFISTFAECHKLCGYPKRRFKKRLEDITANFVRFHIGIVSDFKLLVQSKMKPYPELKENQMSTTKERMPMGLNLNFGIQNFDSPNSGDQKTNFVFNRESIDTMSEELFTQFQEMLGQFLESEHINGVADEVIQKLKTEIANVSELEPEAGKKSLLSFLNAPANIVTLATPFYNYLTTRPEISQAIFSIFTRFTQ